MELNLAYGEGQTPLDEDEKQGLLFKSISTKGELDELEQKNIEKAVMWVMNKSFRTDKILTEKFIRELHYRMFGDVWSWAGHFRQSDKNIGIKWSMISIELRKLIDDTLFWVAKNTYPEDEIAIRFKHRIVSIHCFSNGNGRHSRLIADIISKTIFKKPEYTWGSAKQMDSAASRSGYLTALRKADKGDIAPLIQFARS